MRRGSSRLRLPRGRRSPKASPKLMGIAIFLVILVPTLFYLFPGGEPGEDATQSTSSLPSGQDSMIGNPTASSPSADEKDYPKSLSSEPVLRVASSDVSLLAVVNSSPEISQVYLENNGITSLHKIMVKGRDRSLGTLSELDPGEKKVLSISGRAEKVAVFALDPTGLEIQGRVLYNSTNEEKNESETVLNKEAIVEPVLFPMSIPAGGVVAMAPEVPVPEKPASPVPAQNSSPSLALNISANRSAVLAGEAISYRCLVINTGESELSDVLITCAGKIASTSYLPPHKELQLDGIVLIENSTRLAAQARAKDAKGNNHTNITSIDIRTISPQIALLLRAPELVHRGENATILIQVQNSGKDNLTDLEVNDVFGPVSRIPLLAAGEVETVQQRRIIHHSLPYEVMVSARDELGGEVYSRQIQTIAVMNSSLQIQSERAQVATYPGEPAEVTWILKNTGQEILKNITLQGDGTDCILPQMLPGKSVRMAAIYSKNSTSWINVTARAVDSGGFETTANASVLIRAIQPGISLKVMPGEIEVAPGDTAEISCLVTNSGEDRLRDVVLTLDGKTLSSLGNLEPGEFRVVEAKPLVEENCTLHLAVSGEDSQGAVWSDEMAVEARTVITAIKVFASASPSAVAPGGTSSIICTVANTGSVPLYSIFVISKNLGPLGSIDFLSPKHQKTISAEKTVSRGGEDTITAEGFTMDRKSVRGEYQMNLVLIEGASPEGASEELDDYPGYSVRMVGANISYGNSSLPFNLPEEKSTITQVSGTIARDLDQSAQKSNNVVIEGVSNLIRYVEDLLGLSGENRDDEASTDDSGSDDASPGQDSAGGVEPTPMPAIQPTIKPQSGKKDLVGAENYELSIAGVRSSEHGAIAILDVNAQPSQPAAEEDVKVTVHLKSSTPITDAYVKYGLSDAPLTGQSMKGIDRVYETELVLESGDEMDGYWSGTIPGRSAGTYMPLSIWISDESSTAEGGPYLIHWSTVKAAPDAEGEDRSSSSLSKKLFIESSSVKGEGEISIKDNFNGAAMHYNDKMMGNGSISMETQRSIDRRQSIDSFTEAKDLVFTGGNLKGHKTVESPRFDGGMGASVSERYNLSHVDRSESSSVSSAGYANNSLNFKTDQAFNGTWNIQTNYAKLFKRVKADQQYKGSFQTEKDIQFQDVR